MQWNKNTKERRIKRDCNRSNVNLSNLKAGKQQNLITGHNKKTHQEREIQMQRSDKRKNCLNNNNGT